MQYNSDAFPGILTHQLRATVLSFATGVLCWDRRKGHISRPWFHSLVDAMMLERDGLQLPPRWRMWVLCKCAHEHTLTHISASEHEKAVMCHTQARWDGTGKCWFGNNSTQLSLWCPSVVEGYKWLQLGGDTWLASGEGPSRQFTDSTILASR